MGDPKKLLRTKEAANYLGVSSSFLAKKRLTGDGPVFVKLGRTVVYSLDDLDAWFLSRKHLSTSEFSN